MRMDEVKEWAADVMQKTFDGKKWKFARTAENIAEKAYAEGVDAGFAVARSILDLSYDALCEMFPEIDFDDWVIDDCNIYALNQLKNGRDALKLWGDHLSRELDKGFPDAEKDNYMWLLYYKVNPTDVARPYLLGTYDECEKEAKKSDFLRGKAVVGITKLERRFL